MRLVASGALCRRGPRAEWDGAGLTLAGPARALATEGRVRLDLRGGCVAGSSERGWIGDGCARVGGERTQAGRAARPAGVAGPEPRMRP